MIIAYKNGSFLFHQEKWEGQNLSNQNENIHNSYDSPVLSTILFKFIIIVDLTHLLHKHVLIKKILH